MLRRTLFVLAFTLLFVGGVANAQIDRSYEPIVVSGDSLLAFPNLEVERLYVYTYHVSTDAWEMIPFQIDEVNPAVQDSVKYFVQEDTLHGVFDIDDEIVFMARDLGDRADSTKWVESTYALRYEMEFTDTLNGQKGYAYVYYSESPLGPVPDTYQMSYDENTGRIETANYLVGFNNTGQMGDVLIAPEVGGSGTDIFDRLKLRVIGSFYVFIFEVPVYLDEDLNITGEEHYAKVGPVRIINNRVLNVHLNYDFYPYEEDVTQTIMFYPWCGSFQLLDLPIKEPVPNLDLDIFRVSWDFNRNATGMRFYSEYNKGGVVIDGIVDEVDSRIFPGELNWTMGSGDQGTMLNIFNVPPLGDKIGLYYHEATDGSHADNTVLREAVDTGDDSSFADNGFFLEGDIEEYLSSEITLSVSFANLFLPPNFDPEEASRICEQFKAPLALVVRDQKKHGWPTSVAQTESVLPTGFHLTQNFPNPFNSMTSMQVNLPRPTHASLRIYDASGRLVATLVNESLSAGTHRFTWVGDDDNGRAVPSGVYFCRLTADDYVAVRKLLMIE